MYGTQTITEMCVPTNGFENDVKMYGTQTDGKDAVVQMGLRMM